MKCTKCGKNITWEKYLNIVDEKPICNDCYEKRRVSGMSKIDLIKEIMVIDWFEKHDDEDFISNLIDVITEETRKEEKEKTAREIWEKFSNYCLYFKQIFESTDYPGGEIPTERLCNHTGGTGECHCFKDCPLIIKKESERDE